MRTWQSTAVPQAGPGVMRPQVNQCFAVQLNASDAHLIQLKD